MTLRAGFRTACVLSFFCLGACVVAPDQDHRVDGRVMVAPPPPREEAMGAPPDASFVWKAGYWRWIGGRYEWQPGGFAPGKPGYHWVAPTWVREGDGWRLREGRWVRG